MNEHFLNYEQSLEVRELGFNEPCLAFYERDKEFIIQECEITDFSIDSLQAIAPLKSQFFKWVREKYGLTYSIVYFKNTMLYGWSIHYEGVFEFINTYEEAELECLKKLIEIVKTKI